MGGFHRLRTRSMNGCSREPVSCLRSGHYQLSLLQQLGHQKGSPTTLHIDTLSHWPRATCGKMHGRVHTLRSTEVLSHRHTSGQPPHIHTCAHTYTQEHTNRCIYTYTGTQIHTQLCLAVGSHTQVHTQANIQIYTQVYTDIHRYIHSYTTHSGTQHTGVYIQAHAEVRI